MEAGTTDAIREFLMEMPIVKFAGVEVTNIGLGRLEVKMALRPELCVTDGIAHAGIVGMLADLAGGGACYTMLPPTWGTTTADHTIKFLAPAAGEHLLARGRVVQSGKQQSIGAVDVISVRDGVERLCATGLVTMRNLAPPAG
jgi:uncharacterized protein (TIGR00369 family)